MAQQTYKRKRFAKHSVAHAPPATWVVGCSQPKEAQSQQETEDSSPSAPTVASGQTLTADRPEIHAHYMEPVPQVASTPVGDDFNLSVPQVSQNPNPVWDLQMQHLVDMGFRQGFIQLDKLSMPEALHSTQDIPQICINRVRTLLRDFNTSLETTRRLVADTFQGLAPLSVQQPIYPMPTTNQLHLALYQDFRLCTLVLSILHDTETALTNHCANPSARLCRTLLLRYASTFITAEYILAWYHVFRTDGRDRFDMQAYLSRMTKLLWARLALVPALFHRRRWAEVFTSQGPGKEAEVKAGAGWDLSMAARLDLVKLLAEYSVYSVTDYTPGYLVGLMEVGNPCSEMFQQWSFRGQAYAQAPVEQ
ncbi:hypothetical protein EV426DRAFT_710880 [Tirmania nivea]|nr:hypothetical protein EV426DRAFT_710880 [Tirmania nivea]